MVEIKNLWGGYPGKQVLQHVNFSIPSEKITVILGPNGCGKSTLLKTLCGILPAEHGQVLCDGEDLLGLPPKVLAQRVAYLAQGRQVPDITAYDLVLHGRFPHLRYPRQYKKSDHSRVQAAMECLGVWEHRDTLLEKLSGGQRQKVYLAMALAQDTPLILLDEPTTYLDISHQLQLLHLAKDLAHQGKTVVMVIHHIPHAFQVADQLVLMNQGNIITQGTPEQLFASGAISDIFHVDFRRIQTEAGWRYYCEDPK